jgi:CTD kinase subunit alpha
MQDKAPKTQRGKHPRSVSRSRSRSPTESYYSRRSSRGRSKSRSISPSPKRRRRGISPPAPRSRTPSDRGRTWNSSVHLGKGHSPSPTPARSPGSVVDGRRSISSTSSVSTERSPSRSPRTRSIHRLPLTTAPTSLSPTSQRTLSNTRDVRQRNGKVHTNGKQSNVRLFHISIDRALKPMVD